VNTEGPTSVDPIRLIAVVAIAAGILIAIVIGMGTVTFSSPNNVPSVTAEPAASPTAAPPAAAGSVKGSVTVSVHHLSGHTYRFLYTVRDTGKTPIAGFQINGNQANLFNVKGPGWNVFGNGICNGSNAGLLVYWSTNSAAPNRINPGKSATFGFDVNTSGTIESTDALSYGTDNPMFSNVQAPKPSSLPAGGPCK